jgi:hypothetical protein
MTKLSIDHLRSIDKSQLSVFGKSFHQIERGHGSFFGSLFDTFLKGSQGNRKRIADAFPEYFNDHDITLDYPTVLQGLISKVMEHMYKDRPLVLSDIGKNEINGAFYGSANDKWYVHTVNSDFSIGILSVNDEIFENADLSWFVFE